jgi:hypothetical protein
VTDLATGPPCCSLPTAPRTTTNLNPPCISAQGKFTDWNVSYVYSKARGDLNTLTQLFVPFEQPVIRDDAYSNLGSDVPNRIVSWGTIQNSPVGNRGWPRGRSTIPDFPYAPVDMQQDYIGIPNTKRSRDSFRSI